MTTKNKELAVELEPMVHDVAGQFDLGPVTSVRLLTFSENAVYRVEVESGEIYVVRLHSIGYHSKQDIESELTWMEAVSDQTSVSTAPVLRTAGGERVVTASAPDQANRHAVVFGFLDGVEPAEDNWLRDFTMLGRTAAQLHEQVLKWEIPPGFTRLHWDIPGSVGPSANWGPWFEGPFLTSDDKQVIGNAVDLLTRRLTRFGRGRDRFGLIHADFRLANLLVTNDSDIHVLDFDDCGFGWFLYDLAGALTFNEAHPQLDELVARWLSGYRQIRPVSEEEEREIPSFILMRRLTLLAWLGSRPDTELVRTEGPLFAKTTAEIAEQYLRTHALT